MSDSRSQDGGFLPRRRFNEAKITFLLGKVFLLQRRGRLFAAAVGCGGWAE